MVNYGYTDAPSADLYDSRAWTRHADPLSYGTPLMGPDLPMPEPVAQYEYLRKGFYSNFWNGYQYGMVLWDNNGDSDPVKRPAKLLNNGTATGFYIGWTCRHIGDLRGVNAGYERMEQELGRVHVNQLDSVIDFRDFMRGYRQGAASGRILNCGRVQPADAYSMGYVKARLDNHRKRTAENVVLPYNEVVTQLRWEGVI